MRNLVAMSVVGVGVVACHTAPPVEAGPRLQLDGAVVRTTPDPLTQLTSYDPPLLFHLAVQAEEQGQPERARALYERLIAEFPASPFVTACHFNLGLLLEQQQAFAEAMRHYGVIIAAEPPHGTSSRRVWLDAHFRRASCASRVGDAWAAVVAFDAVLDQPWVDESDRLEAMVGKGIALQQAAEPAAAELVLSQALRLFVSLGQAGRLEDRGLAFRAAYELGEISRAEFAALPLALDEPALVAQLERKCELLLTAQSRYLRAIRFGDAHTAAVAGLRLGSLYETLYDQIVTLQPPADFDAEARAVYETELRRRVHVLVEKALVAYERSLAVGRRAPDAGEWVARLEAAVERLQRIYLASDGD